MIISISGKAGSGKDTVGSIIQDLTRKRTKGVSGLTKQEVTFIGDTDWQIKKYSDKLKDMVCILIGCTREELEDQEFKVTPLGKEWQGYRVSWHCPGNEFEDMIFSTEEDAVKWLNQEGAETDIEQAYKDRCLFEIKLTPRDILQSLGTDFGRDMLHPNGWVNALFADYKFTDLAISKYRSAGFSSQSLHGDPYPNWIITDSRFPNDVKRTHEMGGILIRVNRAECEGRANEHVSETALDDFNEWDYVIENNGTIEELIGQVRTILEEAGIIKEQE